MRRTAFVVFGLVMLASGVVCAQAPPPINTVVVEGQARRFLDSLAQDARANRIENAGCLTRYAVRGNTLIVEELRPAVYVYADSVAIYAHAQICAQGVPSIHTHVAYDGWPHPSDTDLNTNAVRGIWGLLLSVRNNNYTFVLAYP